MKQSNLIIVPFIPFIGIIKFCVDQGFFFISNANSILFMTQSR